MTRYGFQPQAKTPAIVAAVLLSALVSVAAQGAEVRQYANGIRATIFTAAEVLGTAKTAGGGGSLEVVTPNGSITLQGDPQALVPFEFDHVDRALAGMHGFETDVDVNVYLLPAIPVIAGGSFARQDGIYLAPGTGPVAEQTAAYITTHEMGHVLTWAFLDRHPTRWANYLALRGLDAATSGADADHADRAREIIAEDMRFLFGGPQATRTNSIENHDLTLPDRVAGLRGMLVEYLAGRDPGPVVPTATAYPNPFNPLTTIVMAVPGSVTDGAAARLRVYDIRGALVRSIDGGNLANGRVTIPWNGTTDAGRAVSSGRYLYVMQVAGLVAKGSLSLVR